ncbi:hypothetical protein PENPOL_c008G02995 [Penicillium polonicum]|uniref:Uncharacterized protein n=1 Tax=Penicillium polonicum TaxID=60169 RepID=A0A1V6NHP6_PENPO|nr:hypothetical protein PENPOL_c008G02995 [Penicillium polonicum]
MNMRRDPEEGPEILTRSNWKSWKNEIEKHARKEGVWKYCNPDALGEYYPELHEPEKPHISTVRPEAKSIVDLGEDDFIELSSIVDQYWKQMRAYENIQTKLQVIFELIENHVDFEHFSLIKHAETPLEQMAVLSVKFKKSRLEDLQPRWERIQELANKPDVQALFKLWNSLFTDCDGYLSSSARRRDVFWDCVERAGDISGNWLPLTSQHWIIQNPEHVESNNCGDVYAQPRSPARRDSITSQHWIEHSDHVEPRSEDDCTQPRSSARRESTTSLGWVKAPDHSESRNYRDVYVQPRSPAMLEPEAATFLEWIKTPDNFESRSHGDCGAQPHSPKSITSQDFIKTPDHSESRNYGDDCAQLRSGARRGSIASRYRLGYYEPVVSTGGAPIPSPHCTNDYEPTVSTGRTSLSPQPGSLAAQSDQHEEVFRDDSEVTGLIRSLRLPGMEESET